MIKAEVVFDGDTITIGKFMIINDYGSRWLVVDEDVFDTLEQAITYCLEN